MDYRPVNIRLSKGGSDDQLAEYLGKFDGTAEGRAGGAKRLMYRALGLPEPPLVLAVPKAELKQAIKEAVREVIQGG